MHNSVLLSTCLFFLSLRPPSSNHPLFLPVSLSLTSFLSLFSVLLSFSPSLPISLSLSPPLSLSLSLALPQMNKQQVPGGGAVCEHIRAVSCGRSGLSLALCSYRGISTMCRAGSCRLCVRLKVTLLLSVARHTHTHSWGLWSHQSQGAPQSQLTPEPEVVIISTEVHHIGMHL